MKVIAARGRIDSVELARYRALDCAQVLAKLADYVKSDLTFTPILNGHTHRWHVHVAGRDFEILTTGPKFFDTRAKRGGGGAVDLAMHLLRLDFKQAVGVLRQVL